MPGDDAFDQATFLHPLDAISDLVLVRHKQRASALERDADLSCGESPWPAQDDPPDGTGHASPCEHEVGDGRSAGIDSLFSHDAL